MAGSKTIQQILGYVPLTGLIQATVSGIPNTLPPGFMKKSRDVLGDQGLYTRVTGERRTARVVKYGASAIEQALRTVATVPVKLIHSFQKQPIPPLVMQQLRQYERYEVQRMGMQEVARQVKEFGQLFGNLRIATVQQVLANGSLYVDAGGGLLPNSSGSSETYSFQMNGNNQNQLNGVIAASWHLAATNIPNQLVVLEQRAAQLTGYPLKYAIYGANVPTYLTQNDYVIEYLARNPEMKDQWLKNPGVIPQGLFGYTWIPAYTYYYYKSDVDDTDITQANKIWPDDQITFTPEISEQWWEVLEGSYLVPSTLDLLPNAQGAMDAMKMVYGPFAYGQLTHDPPGVCSYMGDTFLPVLRNPDVIFQATVKF